MNKSNFVNRELSWLQFNERVMQEAQDESVPLIQRLRFLGIFSNNLDEFFKVRVASLSRLVELGSKPAKRLAGDLTPMELMTEISEKVIILQESFFKVYDSLLRS